MEQEQLSGVDNDSIQELVSNSDSEKADIETYDISNETRNEARKKAVEHAAGLYSRLEGMLNIDAPSIVESSFRNLLLRREILKDYSGLEFIFKKDADGEPVVMMRNAKSKERVELPTPEELAHQIVNQYDGYVGQILGEVLEFEDCETVYSNVPKEKLDKIDRVVCFSDYLSSEKNNGSKPRKDIILLKYYFEQNLGRDEDSSFLSDQDYKEIGKYVVQGLENYNEARNEWRKRNKEGTPPTGRELLRWYTRYKVFGGRSFIEESLNPNEKRAIKEFNRTIDQAWDYIGHSYKDAIKNNLFGDDEDSSRIYLESGLGDGIFLQKNGRIAAILDVKSYPPKFFKVYRDQLELSVNLENKIDELTASTLMSRGAWTKNLSTFITPGYGDEFDGMTLGVDIEGLRKMAQVMENIPEEVDYIDPITAEVTTKKYEPNFPVVLRFPNDIDGRDFEKFTEIIEEKNIKNIIIQKLPFTSEEIRMMGHRFFERWYNQQKVVESVDEVKTLREISKGGHGNLYTNAVEILSKNKDNVWNLE